MKLTLTATAILVATCAASQASAEPIWDKVEFGMSRAQVEALYPSGSKVDYQSKKIEITDVTIMEGCDAEANVHFNEQGMGDQVTLAGNPSMKGRCSDQVMTALAAKYGQPANWDSSGPTLITRPKKIMIWSRPDGVAMRFQKYNTGFGGGGLLKASWELSYTRVGADFTL